MANKPITLDEALEKIDNLEKKVAASTSEINELKAKLNVHETGGLTAEQLIAVREKVQAGLPHKDAIEVVTRQAAHDAAQKPAKAK